MKRVSILFIAFILCFGSQAQNQFFSQEGLENATIGYVVINSKTGETIFSKNESQCITPASITKTITTATALEMLGSNFRYETKLEYDGALENGVLRGNLYVKGGGDPTLGSYRLGDPDFIARWAEMLYAKGIRSIQGDIIADVSLFDAEGVNPWWLWGDVGNYYAAGVYALSCYDNMCRVTLSSGKEGTMPTIEKIEPNIQDLKIENRLLVKNIRSDSAYFFGAPLCNERRLFGAVPMNQKQFIIRGDIPNPPMLLATQLYENLGKKGIVVNGKPSVQFESSDGTRTVLHVNYSRPLSEIVKEVNFQSNNFYADHLFRYLALNKYEQSTWQGAQYVVKRFWKEKGLNTDNIFLFDGSGLSPQDAISPRFFAEVLLKMCDSKEYTTFYNSLPVGGESGTVRSFLLNTPLKGQAHIKSGSSSQVQCYAGYIYDKYIFVIMANNFTCSRKELCREMERLLQSILFNEYTATQGN